MIVTLHFPGLGVDESLEAELTYAPGEVGLYELRTHGSLIPLAPGDRVRIDESNEIVSVEYLEPLFCWEVGFHLPKGVTFGQTVSWDNPAAQKVGSLMQTWERATWITITTMFTCVVSSQTEDWFNREVVGHPYVHYTRLVRTPDLKLDLATDVTTPDMGDGEAGPWAMSD